MEQPHLRDLIEPIGIVARNPFHRVSPWTCYETFKLLVCGPTIFLVRCCIGFILFVFTLIVAVVMNVGIPVKKDRGCSFHEVPFSGWRSCLAWILLVFVRGALWCFGFWRIKVTDRRQDRSQRPNIVVAAPHMTMVDNLILYYALPPMLCGVGDAAISKVPFLGCLAMATQGIFVNLGSAESREACRDAIARRADPTQWSGWPTLIFPEGRLTNGSQLIQFKLGAFHPGEPVLPVVLRYPYRHFNLAGHSRANRGNLWPLRAMIQFYNRCEVEILDIISPSEVEKADASLFARHVRQEMARALGVGTTEHSYADAALFREALRAHVFVDFEVQAVEHMFEVHPPELKQWLQLFKRIDRNRDGRLDRREFVKWLLRGPLRRSSRRRRHRRCCDWHGKRWLGELFDIFDTDSSGYIEFRELVQGLALFSGRTSEESRMKLAFILMDKDCTGSLRPDDPPVRELLNSFGIAGRDGGIGWEEFCDLARGQPQVLDVAVEQSSFCMPKL